MVEIIERREGVVVPFYPRLNHIPRTRRAKRAIGILREYASRHLHADMDKILIDEKVNQYIWNRGREKPPRKIIIDMTKDDEGYVEIYLAGEQAVQPVEVAEIEAPVGPEEPIEPEEEEEEEEEED